MANWWAIRESQQMGFVCYMKDFKNQGISHLNHSIANFLKKNCCNTSNAWLELRGGCSFDRTGPLPFTSPHPNSLQPIALCCLTLWQLNLLQESHKCMVEHPEGKRCSPPVITTHFFPELVTPEPLLKLWKPKHPPLTLAHLLNTKQRKSSSLSFLQSKHPQFLV